MIDLDAGKRAVIRAREADDRLWSRSNHGAGQYRQLRDQAVLEAVNAGVPLEHIADELGVLIRDIENMAAAARGS